MPRVTLASNASGAGIVLAANTIFAVQSGAVELSTDAGTTWIEFAANEKITIANGLTVQNRNTRGDPAVFSHMAI